MTDAPYLEEVKEALDEYHEEMDSFDVDIASSYHIEEKDWMGVKLRTRHDGVYVLLKILRNHGFVPSQINIPDEGDGLQIYIDEYPLVSNKTTTEGDRQS